MVGQIGANRPALHCIHGVRVAVRIGTVINAVAYVLGDYTDTLQFRSLERHESGTARNDLAKIVGKRFVTVPESNTSVRLDEGLIKRLTGRDEFTARFLYCEFFTFTPQAKFWLASNHMPTFEDSSEAWRDGAE